MPWSPEDWEALLPSEAILDPEGDPCLRGILEFLARLPHREDRWILDIGGDTTWLGRDHGFGGVVRLRGLPSVSRSRFHVALLLCAATLPTVHDLDELFERVRSLLIEGGLFIAAFAAAPADGAMRPMKLSSADDPCGAGGLHEIDLQFRLHRAGFQGLRIRRLAAGRSGSDRLVAIAARRASN